jgi:hypothetical protein
VSPKQQSSRPYLLAGLVWFLIAVGVSATGRLSLLRPPVPQLILLGLTVALLAAGATLPGFRGWLASLNLRQLIALHLTRFVGIYFLILHGRGELPYAFAVPGGWGDIVVAAGALVLVLFVRDFMAQRPWVLAWNVVGFVDILFVVGTATRLAMANPDSLAALLRLPLSLLPTFLVPLIVGTHVLLFRRLRRERV